MSSEMALEHFWPKNEHKSFGFFVLSGPQQTASSRMFTGHFAFVCASQNFVRGDKNQKSSVEHNSPVDNPYILWVELWNI